MPQEVSVAASQARTGRAKLGAIELAYDVFGDRGRPLVLIMGIGAQRIFWPEELCLRFVDAGFHVARFDHRDIGQSTHLKDLPTPRANNVLVQRMLGRVPEVPYRLSDMASDVVGLLDTLGFSTAHVVGASLGGMVAQHLAIEHPSRIRSMTSIMSTPGGRRYLPQPRALRALFMQRPRNATEAGERIAETFRVLGSTMFPSDDDRMRAAGALAFERGMNPRGFLRHFAAVLGTPDRRAKLRDTRVPTLVIHGSVDPMFPLRAGRDLARMMPDATWLPIAGMGHHLPDPLWPTIVAAITRHAERAESRARV
ncbi:MAG: alpha/beta fold hydrolase [Kofleriaceae bacterium]